MPAKQRPASSPPQRTARHKIGSYTLTGKTRHPHRTKKKREGSGYSSSDTLTAYTHHDTDATNQIVQHHRTPSSVATTDFHYDKAGNVILDDKHFYKYDAWNRVAAVSKRGTLAVSGDTFTGAVGDLLSVFYYDALGRRINKRVYNSEALNTTGYGDYFYYDGHRVLEHRKTNASDTAVEPHRRYVYGLDYIDEVVAYYDTGAADPDPHFVLQDANYDVVGVTDHQGYLEQQYAYAPYGAYQYIEDGSGVRYNNMDADLTALLIPLGRNGLFLDRETGLYYNRARYYDPLLSRFLQADPNGTGLVLVNAMMKNAASPGVASGLKVGAQYGDGMSLYGYVRSNPAMSDDPLGLWHTGVHHGLTARWARSLGFTPSIANAIGAACDSVDGEAPLHGGTGPAPWGDQSYHFDIPFGGVDSRLEHKRVHLWAAIQACTQGNDLAGVAAIQLGFALHPIQDWVAHGDHGKSVHEGGIWFKHNKKSPQADLLGAHGDPGDYPDDPTLDAVNGPDGRPAGRAVIVSSNFGVDYDYAYYMRGTQRIRKTELVTKGILSEFRNSVRLLGRKDGACRKMVGMK